ncbi:MAG TPA: hypothetical protein P5055_07220 [Candidatus Paceibacterota bacterium]|nr:hypothetical protein [Candidatus Paceibacterota bacterium]
MAFQKGRVISEMRGTNNRVESWNRGHKQKTPDDKVAFHLKRKISGSGRRIQAGKPGDGIIASREEPHKKKTAGTIAQRAQPVLGEITQYWLK